MKNTSAVAQITTNSALRPINSISSPSDII
jgi:hypothetical protein